MEYTPWLEKQIIGRMKVENPWWTEGRLSNDYSTMSPRQYMKVFFPLVIDSLAVALHPATIEEVGELTVTDRLNNLLKALA